VPGFVMGDAFQEGCSHAPSQPVSAAPAGQEGAACCCNGDPGHLGSKLTDH
jgi:hypothetical protein